MTAEMPGILLAFFCAREIEVAAKRVGDGKIGLKNAAEHLLVEPLLKLGAGLEHGVGVGVFRLEVGDDFGTFLLAEPGVVIDAAIPVKDLLDRFTASPGRSGRSGG